MRIATKQDIRDLVAASQILSSDYMIELAAQGSGSNLWRIGDQKQVWMLKQPRTATAELTILQQWQQYGQVTDTNYLLLPLETFPATKACPAGGWLLPYLETEYPAPDVMMTLQAQTLAQLHTSSRQWGAKIFGGQQKQPYPPIYILKQWIEGWLLDPQKLATSQDQQIAAALWAEYHALSDLGDELIQPVPPVLCHRDLVAENWLFSERATGQHACLIDWEWADWQHPAWDLAFWIAEIPQFWGQSAKTIRYWGHAQQQQALSLYHQSAPEIDIDMIAQDIARLKPWINLGCLSWGFWLARLSVAHQGADMLDLYQAKIKQFDVFLPDLMTFLTIEPGPGRFDNLPMGCD